MIERRLGEARPTVRLSWTDLAVAGALITLVYFSDPPQSSWKAIFVLSLLSILGELWAVPVTRFGLKLGFSLPFLAALFVFGGLGITLVVGLLAVALSAWLSTGSRLDRLQRLWSTLRRSGILLLAGGGMAFAVISIWPVFSATALEAVAFLTSYAIANLTLLTFDRDRAMPSVRLRLSLTVLPHYLLLLTFFGLVSVVAADLIRFDWILGLPLLMLAILALRAVVVIRNRQDDQFHQMVVALSLMMQRAHPYTRGHLERVGRWCYEVGLRMGLTLPEAHRLQQAAILHDIGKIAVDERILDLPRRLSIEQYKHVQRHAELGADILEASPTFRAMGPWIRAHHERPDGAGYPHGLRDIEIPLASKVIAVADAFDAMVGNEDPESARRYRPPLSPAEALAELERCTPDQFDPEVVDTFREVVFDSRRMHAL